MTTRALSGAVRNVFPKIESGVVRDIAVKTFYFSLVTSAFLFVLALLTGIRPDLLPNLPSFIRRVCSGYAPDRGVLRTQSV